jgi:hypothetical protein
MISSLDYTESASRRKPSSPLLFRVCIIELMTDAVERMVIVYELDIDMVGSLERWANNVVRIDNAPVGLDLETLCQRAVLVNFIFHDTDWWQCRFSRAGSATHFQTSGRQNPHPAARLPVLDSCTRRVSCETRLAGRSLSAK